jgi:hypothetical protein
VSVRIEVGGELQDQLRKLELAAPGAMGRALDSKLITIVRDARAAWPVRTGLSARALTLKAELEERMGHPVVVRIVSNKMKYAGGIEFKGTDDNVAQALVFGPIEAALRPILEAFAEEIRRAG